MWLRIIFNRLISIFYLSNININNNTYKIEKNDQENDKANDAGKQKKKKKKP